MTNAPILPDSRPKELANEPMPPKAGIAAPQTYAATGSFLNQYGLQLGGALNLIGDASLLYAGYKNKDPMMTIAGVLYTGGALALTRYGTPSPERQLREVCEGTATFLKEHVGTLPQGSQLATVHAQQNRGLIDQVESTLYRNPVDTMLGLYTAGAATMLASGIQQGNKWRSIYGAWSLGVKAISFALPEKEESHAEDTHKKQPDSVLGWIKEKPLRLFGYGSLVTEVLLGKSAIADLRAGKEGAMFSVATAVMYVLSDIVMAISSKNTSSVDGLLSDKDQKHIERLAAEIIAQQPAKKQARLIDQVSEFLVKQPAIKGSEDEINTALTQKVQQIASGAWSGRVAATPKTLNISK